MPNTYTQIYIHIVFTVKGRKCLILESFREELQKYMTGIIQNRGHKMLAIYCMPDHVHIFTGMKPDMGISDLMREVKAVSSKFINEKKWIPHKFNWQEGYGAFSYANSQIDTVVRYVNNQKQHHEQTTFREEYLKFLEEFSVKYDERYLFEWLE